MFGLFRGLGKTAGETVMKTPMLDFMIVGSASAFLLFGVKVGMGVSDEYCRTESKYSRRYFPKYKTVAEEHH